MIWLLRSLVGLVYFGIGMATALAIAAAWIKQWKVAIKRGAAALGGFVVAFVGIGALSAVYAMHTFDGTQLRPEEKARVLAETISTLMNFGSLGFPVGLVAGAAVALRSRRRK